MKNGTRSYTFPKFDSEKVKQIRNNHEVSNFDMSKLEVENDYETDQDEIKDMLSNLEKDLRQAVNFFVKKNPLNLVANTSL